MSQPGAASRLTAVYRYVMEAARDRMSGRTARLGVCPACEHDAAAAGRALDTLLEGLNDNSVRDRYRELGGLCIPHLRAAPARGGRRALGWLLRTMTATVGAWPDSTSWLAGTDHDAEARAVLRQSSAAGPPPGSHACLACLAASRSESGHLGRMLRSGDRSRRDRQLLLCAGHLSDLVVLAGRRGVAPLLAWQAGCLAADLTWRPMSSRGRRQHIPASWLRSRRRPDGCLVCLASQDAAQRALDDFRVLLRASQPVPDRQPPLCVRHLLDLRAVDPWAGLVTAHGAMERADLLIAELGEAFSKGTWARRHETRGQEMTAWRRAAVFLDGGVFCGCPPRET